MAATSKNATFPALSAISVATPIVSQNFYSCIRFNWGFLLEISTVHCAWCASTCAVQTLHKVPLVRAPVQLCKQLWTSYRCRTRGMKEIMALACFLCPFRPALPFRRSLHRKVPGAGCRGPRDTCLLHGSLDATGMATIKKRSNLGNAAGATPFS